MTVGRFSLVRRDDFDYLHRDCFFCSNIFCGPNTTVSFTFASRGTNIAQISQIGLATLIK